MLNNAAKEAQWENFFHWKNCIFFPIIYLYGTNNEQVFLADARGHATF